MSKTLLLADDSVTIQRVIELSFAHEDIRVVSVSDGRRALQYIDTERPDIVVADVGVPEVDGYAIVAHVKQASALRHIPVILLAGAFEPVDEGRARAGGCDGVLVKPFEPQQLVSRVKELIGVSERWAPARTPAAAAVAPAAALPSLKVVSSSEPAPVSKPLGGGSGAAASFEPKPAASSRFGFDMTSPDSVPMFSAAEPLELPAEPIWHTPLSGIAAEAPAPPQPPKVSLANAFSALLAAEQTLPTPGSRVAPPEIPEAAIEEAVRRILARMTGEAVRQVVLDTAERLIREEIEKIKTSHSE
jgi:CheY-like chemotaxis protein